MPGGKPMKKKTLQTVSPVAAELILAAGMEPDALLKKYHTPINGYDEETAEKLRNTYGSNEISHEKPEPVYKRLAGAFANPFTAILCVLAVISFFTDVIMAAPNNRDPSTTIIICTMVVISGLLRFVQETRSNNSAEKLKAMVHTTAAVLRGEEGKKEVPLKDIIPGDILFLAAGDMVPADVRVIVCKDLFVSQSSLTGESEPCEKYDKPEERNSSSPLEFSNLAFMGSTVVSGSATCIVLAIGSSTCFGSMAKAITGRQIVTNFEKGINSVSWVLIRFMLCMVPVVLLVNGFTKGNWLQASLFALSVAVGLTPEMLPMIVTTGLAKGAVAMAKKKTIVKHLNSMQNFGAMDILCIDKTGTITQDKVVLEQYLDIHGNENERVLRHAFLNSYYQTGLKNLMDVAILNHAKSEPYRSLCEKYTKVDEIPFDFNRRRMSVVIRDRDGKTQMITKGAVEEMLSISAYTEYNGTVVKLTDAIRKEILETVGKLNSSGMRVLAVAQKTNPPVEGVFSVRDESDMVLIGYLSFLDPPKETAAAALQALNEYGVTVKVLTGDNDAVTSYVCKQVGLKTGNLLLGSDVETMDDKQLAAAVEKTDIFAKLSPQQKARIVRILRSNDHTVGFMGDGINDAAAMHEADVAVSVDTAVDIAKESADIILLEKDLMVLEQGVAEGRRTFGNIMKYIKMTTSSNFGNMLSVLTASVFLPFLPMQPVQILFLNLIYDISCIAIPWDNMDEEYLKVPRAWNASSIGRFMLWLGPASSVFDIITYAVMFFVICPAAAGGTYGTAGINSTLFVSLFNAGWFTESLWTQTLVIHMIRTPKLPFIQSRASGPLLFSTAAAIAAGTAVPYTPIGQIMGMTALPFNYYFYLISIILGYMVLATVLKTAYRKRYGELL
jgi:P-type Mg2+ transporter